MTEINNGTGNKAKLFAKVAKVMTEVRKLKKDGNNTFDKYKYISGDNAFEHIGGIMASVNLVILPSVYEIETKEVQSKSGGIMYFTTVHAQITLADGETGETWTGEWFGEGSDRGDKSINKAMTAMMKYFLLRVFQIGSGEDADADSPGADEQKQQKPPQQTQRQPTSARTPANSHANATTTPAGNTSSIVAETFVNKVIGTWATPADAYKWAADGGFTENEHSARTRWAEIVKTDFGNTCNTSNIKAVMRAYATHYFNKQADTVAA